MSAFPTLPIYELTRGDIVESIHYGAIAVVNAHNDLVAWHGDANTVTYLRSSAKPFQALPFLEHAGHEKYNLSLQEVAILCASHGGTDEHVAVLQSIQAKTGVKEADLLCGTHTPFHRSTAAALSQRQEQPSENRHNCSGKHTGMVAFSRLMGYSYSLNDQPYIDPLHPIQQEILKTFSEMCAIPVEQIHVGIDGCSAPNFAVPLRNAALGFARLCDPTELPEKRAAACRTIAKAMNSFPVMVGGPDDFFDTQIMQAMGDKIICKGGAEGYQALGVMPGAMGPGSSALGICFKISDGDQRGAVRPAVALEILRQLGVITPVELEGLSAYGPTTVLENFRKLTVGKAYPSFVLNFS